MKRKRKNSRGSGVIPLSPDPRNLVLVSIYAAVVTYLHDVGRDAEMCHNVAGGLVTILKEI